MRHLRSTLARTASFTPPAASGKSKIWPSLSRHEVARTPIMFFEDPLLARYPRQPAFFPQNSMLPFGNPQSRSSSFFIDDLLVSGRQQQSHHSRQPAQQHAQAQHPPVFLGKSGFDARVSTPSAASASLKFGMSSILSSPRPPRDADFPIYSQGTQRQNGPT